MIEIVISFCLNYCINFFGFCESNIVMIIIINKGIIYIWIYGMFVNIGWLINKIIILIVVINIKIK